MESFKIIDISGNSSNKSKKKLSKKQIYREILSSSDKVKEIINNRKKTKRFDYLNMIPKKSNEETETNKQQKSIRNEKTTNNSKIESNQTLLQTQLSSTQTPPLKKMRKQRVKKTKTPKNDVKDSKINDYFKPNIKQKTIENKIVEKAQQSIIEHLQTKIQRQTSPIQAPNNFKPIPIPIPIKNDTKKTISKQINHSNFQLKSQPKQFTQNQIRDIIKIFIKLNSLNQYYKIHKTIRRLNKIKVNQLLFALRLIKKFSNAPDNMLKTTLFNYITSDIRVQLQ